MLLLGAGNYAKELEEDYTVYDAISEVQGILGANEIKCNALKAQYSKYGYLWKRDLNETLKVGLLHDHHLFCRSTVSQSMSGDEVTLVSTQYAYQVWSKLPDAPSLCFYTVNKPDVDHPETRCPGN